MIELDGLEYMIKTPEENTSDLISFINDYCQRNNIQNSLGEVIFIDRNEANPLYMLAFGTSYLTTVLQKLIFSAGSGLSVPDSSMRQLLNIADCAHIKRNAATKTVIQGTVYSNLPDAGAVDCVITREATATLITGTYSIKFHPAFDVIVPIGEARQIVLIAEDYGSYNISENTITAFDEPIAGFRMMTTKASTPGQKQESIASLRQRIQRRAVEGTAADRAAEAIRSLDGVGLCNVYFNDSPTTSQFIGTRHLEVPPRNALVMVQGYSDYIAKAFFSRMVCPTAGEDYPLEIGAYSQDYVTHANQTLKVWIVPPQQVPVYIKIYAYESLTQAQINGIKDIVASMSSSLTIGQSISSKEVLDVISAAYPDITLQGAYVSSDNQDFSYVATPHNDEVFIFNLDNIRVMGINA